MDVKPLYSNNDTISLEYNVEFNTLFDNTKNCVISYYIGSDYIGANMNSPIIDKPDVFNNKEYNDYDN